MKVFCPQCQEPIEVVVRSATESVACPTCGSSFAVDPDATRSWHAEPGRKIGRFEILGLLGQGGFGTVYKARDPNLDRVVALKVPRAGDLATARDLDRFLREARSVAQLRHPSIVPVHEVGEADSLPYLVCDVIDGVTLGEWLSSRRLPTTEAAKLIADLADALQYAHECGVIHRDVKPSNVMFDSAGRPYLMDFGLAKRDAGELTMTLEGQVLGTPAYMSPEQARGEAHCVDGRSDVYSLGVILYRVLTGELPFRGVPRMLLHQVLHDEPRPPRRLNDRIPRDLETICLKAMAKEPARRYQSAKELSADLRRFLAGEPIQARPVGRGERLWRWCRRHPGVASLTALLVLVLVGGAAAATVAALQYRTLAEREGQSRKIAQDAGNDLRRNLSRQYVAKGAEALAAGDHAVAMLWFARALELDAGDPEREAAHRLRLANTWRLTPRLVGIYRHDGPLTRVALCPDGTRVLTAGFDGTARLWDRATGELAAPPLPHGGYVFAACFSPDGKRVATGCGDGTVRLWDAVTGAPCSPPLEHAWSVGTLAFSPDGRKLAAGSNSPPKYFPPPAGVDPFDPKSHRQEADRRPDKPVVALWDVETLTPMRLGNDEGGEDAIAFGFSADGLRLAIARGSNVSVWDVAAGRLVAGPLAHAVPFKVSAGYVLTVALSPDGSRLATDTLDGKWHLWDVGLGKKLIPAQSGRCPFFTPDGMRLIGDGVWDLATLQEKPQPGPPGGGAALAAYLGPKTSEVLIGTKQGVRVWDAERLVAGPLMRVRRVSRGTELGVAGRYVLIACPDHVARLWDRAGQAPDLAPVGGHGCVARYSVDGRRLATGGGGGGRVWDPSTGRPVTPPLRPGVNLRDVRFSADGRLVATAGEDGTAHVWDAVTGQAVGSPMRVEEPNHKPAMWTALFNPCREQLITERRTERKYGKLCTFDLRTGQPEWRVDAAEGYLDLAVSPDGRWLATTNNAGEAKLRDLATGRLVGPVMKHTYWVVSPNFSPNGQLLVTCGGDGLARLWEVPEGRLHVSIRCDGQPQDAAFSPDGRRIVVGDHSGTVRVCDTTTGDPVAPIMDHGSSVETVAFSPDGRWILTGGRNGSVRAWDAATGEPLGPAWRTAEPLQQASFRADGRQICIQGWVAPALLWDFSADDRAPAEWRLLAETEAAVRLDTTGSLTPLTVAEVADHWDELRRRSPDDARLPPGRAESWQTLAARRVPAAGPP